MNTQQGERERKRLNKEQAYNSVAIKRPHQETKVGRLYASELKKLLSLRRKPCEKRIRFSRNDGQISQISIDTGRKREREREKEREKERKKDRGRRDGGETLTLCGKAVSYTEELSEETSHP